MNIKFYNSLCFIEKSINIIIFYLTRYSVICNISKKLLITKLDHIGDFILFTANIKKFREDEKTRVIVLHPKSAAHGVTFTMAHHLIFYSIDHSAEDNYQCIHRIKRAGQKQPMFVYTIMCRRTIDELIYKVIELKNKNQ